MSKKKEIITQCTYDDRGLLIKVERTDEEIVRCKDCKYADWWGPKGREVLDCTHLYVPHVTPDWYCAWGERKEDDT